MITHPTLDLPGFRHAFFTRERGVSSGVYSGRNCGPGSDDDPGAVDENRARCLQDLGCPDAGLVTAHQVHSARAVSVDGPWPVSADRRADGLATRTAGIALGILTADCAPVLFADAHAGVAGAAHAGWKGAKLGILAATVAEMEGLGADRSRIVAVVGPTIRQASYEVGPDYRAGFLADDPGAEDLFARQPESDRFLFDLPGFVVRRLSGLGLRSVIDLELDTYRDPDRFFSYRRAVHRGEPDYGRLLATIVLT